jgi:hypothetical protein
MNEETKRAPSDSPQTPEEALAKAIELAGGARATARHFAISHQVVLRWKISPAKRALRLERLTGCRGTSSGQIFIRATSSSDASRRCGDSSAIWRHIVAFVLSVLAGGCRWLISFGSCSRKSTPQAGSRSPQARPQTCADFFRHNGRDNERC